MEAGDVPAVVAAGDVSGAAAAGSVSTGAAIGRTRGGSVTAGFAVVGAAIVGATVEAGAATVVDVTAVDEELGETVDVTSAASTWVAMVVAGDVATRLDLGVFATLITPMAITAAGINTRFRFHDPRFWRSIGAFDV